MPQARSLVLVCDHLNSRANLSSITRLAGCFGLSELHLAGSTRVDPHIARDAAERVTLVRKRTLPPFLQRLRADGYRLVGLEQTTHSTPIGDYVFVPKTALVIGNERRGL